MASKVYFTDFKTRSESNNKINKVKRLLNTDEFASAVSADDLCAIKIHFGELGNDGYVNPVFVRAISDRIKQLGAKPFITDTNTLYSGSRHNAVDHINTALLHGFGSEVTGAPIIISDGLRSEHYVNIEINKKHFKNVKIAGDLESADSMIMVTHFKGHEMAGFGGAIKNLAMGCSPAAGKRDQHSTRPFIMTDKCVGCGECARVCPENAVSILSKKASIDKNTCIGCGECFTVCQPKAIGLDWPNGGAVFIEKMTEYALGAAIGKKNKIFYINFMMNITPDCDCAPWSDYPIVPDIGIAASTDPVALDKACFDLVNAQHGFKDSILNTNHDPHCDKFRGIRDNVDGTIQLKYGAEIGLGSLEYELIKI